MSALEQEVAVELAPVKRPAYDPNNLHPLDEEARKHDDMSLGIDWDEIIATTQDDFLADRYALEDVLRNVFSGVRDRPALAYGSEAAAPFAGT